MHFSHRPTPSESIRALMRRSARRRDLRGEAAEIFKNLCALTGSAYGGAFGVELDRLRRVVRRKTHALGGPEASYQVDFERWLEFVPDLGEDAMVNAIFDTLRRPHVGLRIVRGEVLPHAYFHSRDILWEQRKKQGISEVSDVLLGYYPARKPGCLIAMCLYRLGSKVRYGRKELNRLGHAVHQHAELYREDEVGWPWRWWEFLSPQQWEAWRLVATMWYTDQEIAKCWSKSEHTVGRVMRELFTSLHVKNRAQLTALYYDPSLIDDEVVQAMRK